tara:strand:- start:395 stop:1003 length:609 start_codon:yes stop_codon:yes gene_type:complete
MFIVFEGIDGCGKSTQIWKLADYLSSKDKYNHILVTREPYKAREIREILKLNESPETKADKLTELFVQDRKEHVQELIKPALEKGIIVISDRYKYSTIAYQSAQGQSTNDLVELHTGFPIPDFVFIVDVDLDKASERMKKDQIRDVEHKFEKNRDFQGKVKENYLKLIDLLPEENIIVLDGNKTIEEIFEDVKKHFIDFKNI